MPSVPVWSYTVPRHIVGTRAEEQEGAMTEQEQQEQQEQQAHTVADRRVVIYLPEGLASQVQAWARYETISVSAWFRRAAMAEIEALNRRHQA